jgi:hypothetical protein
MKCIGIGLTVATLAAGTMAAGFDSDAIGAAPSGWTCGATGTGLVRWTVEPEPGGNGQKVLLQSGSATFPWCVKTGSSLADGFVEVRFKPVSGREDQAGGVVWRFKDGNQYYVARANALENNVSLYYTERGRRRTLKYVDAPVARNVWHTLRVQFSGRHIEVTLDGKRYIETDDDHIAGPGAVGVWTKADSFTAFKDFSFGTAAR